MKKLIFVCYFISLINFCFPVCAQIEPAADKETQDITAQPKNIVVILSKNMSVQDTIFNKFKNKIKKEQDVKVHKFILGEDNELKLKQDQEILSLSPSAIFTIGTKATAYARGINDIPKVFTLVVNPLKESFCTKTGAPLEDMTGILISASPYEKFKLIKEAIPNATRIGVVYDPAKSGNIIAQGINAAKKLNMEIIEAPVTDKSKVLEKFESLSGKIDVLWAVVDNTVYNRKSMEFVLLFSLRNKIPFIGFSENQVKAGALMGIYCDYPNLGIQAAEVVNEILSGKGPEEIPLQNPKIFKYAISERASKIMGIKISAKLRMGADKILSDTLLDRFYARLCNSTKAFIYLK